MVLDGGVLAGHEVDELAGGVAAVTLEARGHDEVAAARGDLVLGPLGDEAHADLVATLAGEVEVVGEVGRGAGPHGDLLVGGVGLERVGAVGATGEREVVVVGAVLEPLGHLDGRLLVEGAALGREVVAEGRAAVAIVKRGEHPDVGVEAVAAHAHALERVGGLHHVVPGGRGGLGVKAGLLEQGLVVVEHGRGAQVRHAVEVAVDLAVLHEAGPEVGDVGGVDEVVDLLDHAAVGEGLGGVDDHDGDVRLLVGGEGRLELGVEVVVAALVLGGHVDALVLADGVVELLDALLVVLLDLVGPAVPVLELDGAVLAGGRLAVVGGSGRGGVAAGGEAEAGGHGTGAEEGVAQELTTGEELHVLCPFGWTAC